MGLGTNLKEILSKRNMTIKELSQKTGISINTLYSITKRDTYSARWDIVDRIANSLEVDIFDLIDVPTEEPTDEYLKELELEAERQAKEDYMREVLGLEPIPSIQSNLYLEFNKLNDTGKREAVKRVQELTEIPKYRKDNK